MRKRERDPVAPDDPQPSVQRRRGPKPGTAAATRGGRAVAERYGREFYSKIGAKGGRAVRDRKGSEFYAEIGKRGGSTTRDTYTKEFYARIGRLGGQRGRGVPKRQASDRLYEAQLAIGQTAQHNDLHDDGGP